LSLSYYLYNLLFILVSFILVPYFSIPFFTGRHYYSGIWQRLGFLPALGTARLRHKKSIWLIASSVGRVRAAVSILRELRKRDEDIKVVVSVTSKNSHDMAHQIFEEAEGIIYSPLDFPLIIRRVLRRLRPQLIVLMDTELWPNLLIWSSISDIPVMVANGRLSRRKTFWYRYLVGFLPQILSSVSIFGMQNKAGAERLSRLGVDKDLIEVTGNTKFDQAHSRAQSSSVDNITDLFPVDSSQKVFIAGSTHAEEEEFNLQVFDWVRAEYSDAVLIIAPWDLKRVPKIKSLLEKKGYKYLQRTHLDENKAKELRPFKGVIILDTLGELAEVYALGDAAFVGGTLVDHGGHNLLEPVAHGIPVFFGPYIENYLFCARLLEEAGVGNKVEDEDEMAVELMQLLEDEERCRKLKEKALEVISENKGASGANARQMISLL